MNQELLQEVGKVVPEEVLQGLLNEWNPIITVDRTVQPVYPDFVEKIKYPELELSGPDQFDVRKLDHWIHPKQAAGFATGHEIHEKILAEKLLESCLGLADLLAIQARGIGFFQKYFLGKAVFGWKSVVLLYDGCLNVPFLFEGDGDVELHGSLLRRVLGSNHPALRLTN